MPAPPTIEQLADQMMRDPAISGPSDEVIPRRPMVDIRGRAFRFGGIDRHETDAERITGVRLISIGAPEKSYWLPTHATEVRTALRQAIEQMALRVSELGSPDSEEW